MAENRACRDRLQYRRLVLQGRRELFKYLAVDSLPRPELGRQNPRKPETRIEAALDLGDGRQNQSDTHGIERLRPDRNQDLVGRSDTLFSDDALALIHQVSRGLPRAVNNLAVQALVAAYATNKAVVDESSARAAVTEVTTE